MDWQWNKVVGYHTAETLCCEASIGEAYLTGWTWVIRFKDEYGVFTDRAIAGVAKFQSRTLAEEDCEQVYEKLEEKSAKRGGSLR